MIDAVNFDEAYRRSREAMLDCLRSRIIDPDGLKAQGRHRRPDAETPATR